MLVRKALVGSEQEKQSPRTVNFSGALSFIGLGSSLVMIFSFIIGPLGNNFFAKVIFSGLGVVSLLIRYIQSGVYFLVVVELMII
jgi:hypothetical protein